jgi:type VI secretion system Hcp family effector
MKSRRNSGIIALVVVLCMSVAAGVAFASTSDYFLVIKGDKQGEFKGEGSGGLTGRIFGSQFSYIGSATSGAGSGKATDSSIKTASEASSGKATGREAQSGKATGSAVAAPRDTATGQMSGKRQHSDITIVKYVGDSSPMFAKAMSTGEILTSVDISFFHGSAANPEIYKTVHMTNVLVSSIKPAPSSGGDRPMESITFSVEPQNIVAKDKAGNKTAMDDWMQAK